MNWERLYHQAVEEVDELKERVRQLNAQLGYTYPGPRFVHLTGQEAKLFGAFMAGSVLTKEDCLHALYYDRPGDEPEQKIVDVFVCKMRKKLALHGIEIQTIWGRGYTMSDLMKVKARDLDKAFYEQVAA